MPKKEIFLSSRAKRNLEALLEYLRTEWSEKVRTEFIEKIDGAMLQVAEFPLSGTRTRHAKNVYRKVVTKQTTFYYRIKNAEMEVITIHDTRRDPKSLKI